MTMRASSWRRPRRDHPTLVPQSPPTVMKSAICESCPFLALPSQAASAVAHRQRDVGLSVSYLYSGRPWPLKASRKGKIEMRLSRGKNALGQGGTVRGPSKVKIAGRRDRSSRTRTHTCASSICPLIKKCLGSTGLRRSQTSLLRG